MCALEPLAVVPPADHTQRAPGRVRADVNSASRFPELQKCNDYRGNISETKNSERVAL